MIKYTLDQCLLTEEEYEIYKIDGGIEVKLKYNKISFQIYFQLNGMNYQNFSKIRIS